MKFNSPSLLFFILVNLLVFGTFVEAAGSEDVSIIGVHIVGENLIQVDVQLNVEVGSLLGLGVNVDLFTELGSLFAGSTSVVFQGQEGEVASAYFVINEDLLNLDVGIHVTLGNLLSLDVNVDVLGLQLGELVGNLLDGVVNVDYSSFCWC